MLILNMKTNKNKKKSLCNKKVNILEIQKIPNVIYLIIKEKLFLNSSIKIDYFISSSTFRNIQR